MTVGEYLILFAAILVGLSVADLSLSLHRLLRAGRRIKWHPIVPMVAFFALCLILNLWWGLYRQYSATDEMTFLGFMPQVLMLLSLFLLSAAVLPDGDLPEGGSLKRHYLDSRFHIWGLVAVYLLLVVINNVIRGVEQEWTITQQAGRASANLIFMGLCIPLMWTSRIIWHWLVLGLFFVTFAISWSGATIGQAAAV